MINSQKKFLEEQAEQYILTLLVDRGLFETLILICEITHHLAEEKSDETLMADSDLIFDFAHRIQSS